MGRLHRLMVTLSSVGFLFVGSVWAQSLRLIDLDQGGVGSGPREFVEVNGVAYFVASVPGLGQLWRSDGTEQGTFAVADVVDDPSLEYLHSLTPVGDRVCFVVQGDIQETLWCSDGTAVGTTPVATPGTVLAGGRFAEGALLGGNWYFASYTDEGVDLWRTDGTVAGTTLAVPGILGLGFPLVFEIVRFGDHLAFAGSTGAVDAELWISDGTPSGTQRVADIRPGGSSSEPRLLTAVEDRLFFLADDGVHGQELWVSDGSMMGTRLVVDLMPGADGLHPLQMEALGENLYITDRQHLWRTDGTEVTVMDNVGPVGFRSLHAVGSSLFVVSDNHLHHIDDASGRVTLVGSFVRRPTYLVPLGNRLTFSVFEAAVGSQLWISDGTVSGTVPISNFLPADQAVIGGNYEGVGRTWLQIYDREHGSEPWLSEGTLASTRRVRDLNDVGNRGSDVFRITPLGDRWLFYRNTFQLGIEPWVTDGTVDGTRLVRDIAPGPHHSLPLYGSKDVPAILNGKMVFGADDGVHGLEPWITDGTEEGTQLLRDIRTTGDQPWSFPASFVTVGGFTYFSADDGEVGRELWRTDGTDVGTISLGDLAPGSADLRLNTMVGADGLLYFLNGFGSGVELWVSDGTPSGTVRVLEGLSRTWLLPFQNGVVFTPDDDVPEVWFSDGSVAGTGPLFSIPGSIGTIRQRPVVLDDRLVFVLESTSPKELWVSDGTPEGTSFVSELPGGGLDRAFDFATLVGRHVYFELDFYNTGDCELWVTDGTPVGTRRVRAFGDTACLAGEGVGVGARYLMTYSESDFVASAGTELWTSDGSFDGTHRLVDLWPGSNGSRPTELTPNGGAVLFAANDGTHGHELWILDDPCLVQSEPLWLHDGRFKTEACWRVEPDRIGASGPLPITATTGGLFFFNPANLDLAIKIHDGRPANGKFWFFLAGLTNVAADVRVVDMHTGRARDFVLPGGSFESTGSIDGFPDLPPDAPVPLTSTSSSSMSMALEGGIETVEMLSSKGVASCDGAALCLNQDRFRVSVAWHTSDQQGEGQPLTLTDNSGTFWFFRPENVELFVKIHDGRPNNGHFWVFLGALSNVGYTVTVTDTQTGARRSYVNEPGTLRSFGDTLAFPG